jgi:FkbM family methyltransferase
MTPEASVEASGARIGFRPVGDPSGIRRAYSTDKGWHVTRYSSSQREGERMQIVANGPGSSLQLRLVRLGCRTGHRRRAVRLISPLFPKGNTATVSFSAGGAIDISLSDPYWARLLVGEPYEEEVGRAIDAAIRRQPQALLLDCGANLGYWSSKYAKQLSVVAVEAVEPTYKTLQKHALRNNFLALHYALSSQSGALLDIYWDPHNPEGASGALRDGDRSMCGRVETISLDDLHRAYGHDRPTIVKLDIEGLEVEAFEGARVMQDQALFIYEDHGKDRAHEPSQWLWKNGFVVLDCDGRPLSPMDLDRVKMDRTRGYNFMAFKKGSVWDNAQT